MTQMNFKLWPQAFEYIFEKGNLSSLQNLSPTALLKEYEKKNANQETHNGFHEF